MIDQDLEVYIGSDRIRTGFRLTIEDRYDPCLGVENAIRQKQKYQLREHLYGPLIAQTRLILHKVIMERHSSERDEITKGLEDLLLSMETAKL